MDEDGLVLNLGDGQEMEEETVDKPVTERDLAELARVEQELRARWPETKLDPSLDRIEMLMDLLGQPQQSYKVIHVAGTNGKTSTVRMIESLLRTFGARVGRTTSPHLQSVIERIGIDGAPIHPGDFVRVYEEIKPYMQLVDDESDHPRPISKRLSGLLWRRLPMPQWTSPSSKWAWAGRGTRPMSSTRMST